MTTPLNVFISSTCYDLVDLRAELAQFLDANGCITKSSDNPASAFHVDPTDDSIASCLANVEAADVVVCIIDRRYGGLLKTGLSATHAEIRHARSLKPPKPVFFFVRDASFKEYDLMRTNPALVTRWVEPKSKEKWFDMMKEIAGLPKHANLSNWCDLLALPFLSF
jgi:Domain of unknown function (DUF4062)